MDCLHSDIRLDRYHAHHIAPLRFSNSQFLLRITNSVLKQFQAAHAAACFSAWRSSLILVAYKMKRTVAKEYFRWIDGPTDRPTDRPTAWNVSPFRSGDGLPCAGNMIIKSILFLSGGRGSGCHGHGGRKLWVCPYFPGDRTRPFEWPDGLVGAKSMRVDFLRCCLKSSSALLSAAGNYSPLWPLVETIFALLRQCRIFYSSQILLKCAALISLSLSVWCVPRRDDCSALSSCTTEIPRGLIHSLALSRFDSPLLPCFPSATRVVLCFRLLISTFPLDFNFFPRALHFTTTLFSFGLVSVLGKNFGCHDFLHY